jgi:hypothetical protein
MGLTRKHPITMGNDVPNAKICKKADVFPGNITWAMVEKTNADNPKPPTTRPVAVARWNPPKKP